MQTLPNEELRLGIVRAAVRRHLALMILVTLAVACAAGAYVLSRPSKYAASTNVLLGAAVGNPLSPTVASANGAQLTVAMQTEAGLVGSSGVVKLLAPALKQQIAASSVTVAGSVPPNTQIVQIQVTAHSAVQARDDAQAVATAFLRYRSNVALSSQRAQLAALAKQTTQVETALKLASANAAARNASASAGQQVQVEANRLVALQNTVSQLQTESTNPGSVVAPAALPTSPSGVNPILLIVGAAVFGLVAGLVLAIWREFRDDRIHSARALEVAGIPMLTSIPAARGSSRDEDVAADAYRRVRAHIVGVGKRPATLAICGAGATTQVSEVTVDLGRSLASAGYRTVVVLSVPADNVASDMLGVHVTAGLSEVLRGEQALTSCLYNVSDMRLLGCGSDTVASRDLYAGDAFASILSQLRPGADFILLATSPLSTGDGDAIALSADNILVVIEDKKTTHEDVAELSSRAALLNTPIVGLVAVPHGSRAPRRRDRSASGPQRPRAAQPDASHDHVTTLGQGRLPESSALAGATEASRVDSGL